MTATTATLPVVAVRVPIPPSVNHCWRDTGRGRAKTRAYLSWEAEARYGAHWPILSEDRTNRIRWRAAFVVHGLSRSSDLDNLLKVLCDGICTFTGLRDNYLDHLTIERGDGAAPGIDVAVWLIEDGGR